jgi:hypothetical protein
LWSGLKLPGRALRRAITRRRIRGALKLTGWLERRPST